MNVLGAPLVASVPWLLGAAACFALAAATRPRRAEALGLTALTVVTFAARAALVPARFFHQNGQGPHQVERVLHGVFVEHGPGMFELLHGAVSLHPRDAEGVVFFVQSLLAATSPACAWLIARRIGAHRPIAGALALAVALDPMLARLARSESYFSTGASLLLLAAAALSLRATRAPPSRPPFLLASLAAGALVAQAARVHPLLWPAASLTPLVLLAGDGSLRRRARASLAAAGVIAAVVLPIAGPSMWRALHSDLAGRLSSQVGVAGRDPPDVLRALLLGVLVAALSKHRRASLSRTLLALPVMLVVFAGNFPASSGLASWIEGGYLRVYTAAFVVVVAASLRDLARTPGQRWGVAALALTLALAPVAVRHAADRIVPTDAREAELARAWRAQIPAGATVVWLGAAAQGTLRLPIYPMADADRRIARPLDVDRLRRSLGDRRARDTWYYRSSLCSTPAGVEVCDEAERGLALRLVRAWTLPAVESYTVPYVTRAVRVALYRVEAPPEP